MKRTFKIVAGSIGVLILFFSLVGFAISRLSPTPAGPQEYDNTPQNNIPVIESNEFIDTNPPLSSAKTPYQRFLFKFVDLKYGGECLPVKHKIRYTLNDPSRYQHVSTDVHMNEDAYIITAKTIVRAANEYGTLITVAYEATLDTNGNILTINKVN